MRVELGGSWRSGYPAPAGIAELSISDIIIIMRRREFLKVSVFAVAGMAAPIKNDTARVCLVRTGDKREG